MSRRLGTVLVVMLSASALLTGCSWSGFKVWVEDTQQLTIPAAGLEGIDVATHNGAVTVTGQANRDTIEVTVQRKAGGLTLEDAEACLEAIEIVSEAIGTDGKTHKLTWRWLDPRHHTWSAAVAFTILMPPRLALRAKTHNGRVGATGLAADIHALTHNGAMELASGTGSIYAETHNGRIHATSAGPQVELKTHNGGIQVTAAGAEHVSIETHNGGVRADLTAAKPVGGRIVSHNGSMTVAFSDDTSADLACTTRNGRIRSEIEWQVTEMSKRRARGKVGDGGSALEIETYNGGIRLVRAAGRQ